MAAQHTQGQSLNTEAACRHRPDGLPIAKITDTIATAELMNINVRIIETCGCVRSRDLINI